MEFQKLLSHRRSIRSFSEKEVDTELIQTIVKEAQTTASWVNSQPWKVYVAKGATLKAIKEQHIQLIEACQKSSPIFPVHSRNLFQADQQENMADWSSQKESYQVVSDEEFWQLNRKLFNAPAILYFALPKASPLWSVFDMGAFVQTATLSANNLGLGTMVAYEMTKFPAHLAESLSVDDNYDIVMGMAIGYDDGHAINQFRAERLPLEDILSIVE